MFGTIHVGLSGLSAYSRGLQLVSNNVTNLNSTGFRGSVVSFSDVFGASGNTGLSQSGDNAGTGVRIAETQLDFRQGQLRQTERDLDLAIDGSGFLMVMKGDETFYTRTGSFEVNKDGHIVLAGTDYRLATLDKSGRPVSLSLDASRTSAPKQTTNVRFAENLSSTAGSFSLSNVKVYDAGGTEHVWKVQFTKPADAVTGEWAVAVTDAKGKAIGTQTLKFNQGIVDPATSKLTFSNSEANLSVALDFSQGVTSFSSGEVSTLRAANVDGHGAGAMTSVAINRSGNLEVVYSNEQRTDLGPVAIADFRDPQSLKQRSGGLFVADGQGAPELTTSEDKRVGRVMSRRLEASNVDLAQQFGDLILIQRGFQASSQLISVTNDMIQQLFGIRGQG
jgi:flagellar hook protein FlgE